jgi:hypothetical protein
MVKVKRRAACPCFSGRLQSLKGVLSALMPSVLDKAFKGEL